MKPSMCDENGISDELRAGIDAYENRIRDLGCLGTTVCGITVGNMPARVEGVLGDAGGARGCAPTITTPDGRRRLVHADSLRKGEGDEP